MAQRREVRELVTQALYAEDVSRDEWQHILSAIIKPTLNGDKKSYKFAERLFLKTLRIQEELDEIIRKHANNWRLDRMAIIDKIILRVALCELLYFKEIPTKVTMNEAIEISKEYSTANSSKFINGVLDSALEELTKEGRIDKEGRGLIQSSINH